MISVLQDTLIGLQEAVAAVTELKIFNLISFEDHSAYKTLARAQTRIKACHKSFGVSLTGYWLLDSLADC
jgi:hypothetical protein